jgi:aerobic carbon-monoxide dehydrogenase medium subunit
MIPPEFEYAAPDSLGHAIRLLRSGEREAKALAGGQSLLPLMKLRLASPTLLVDLRRIPGLTGIQRRNGTFSLGALTRHAEVAETRDLGVAAVAAGLIADQQVRNRGTIGGALAHGDPAGDMPAVLLAAEGSVRARGRFREREIQAEDLFHGYLTTGLEPGEVITRVEIPALEGYGFHYEKYTRRAEDWAMVGVVALVAVRNGTCEDVRVGLTNMGAIPLRAFAVEDVLRGRRIDAEAITRASERAAEDTEPPGDLNASPEYKKHLARVLTRRALERALEQAGPNPQVRPAKLRNRGQLRVTTGAAAGAAQGTGREGGGLEFKHSFDVKAAIDQVWSTFVDVERLAPCLPGAEITEASDRVYHGNFRAKVGPASVSYRGTVRLESADEEQHELVLRASGQDRRGQGSASATITVTLTASDDGTHVDVTTNATITGTLARFGRSGMIHDVADLLMQQFAACVEGKLSGREVSPKGQAIRGGTLVLSLLKARARRLLSRVRQGP